MSALLSVMWFLIGIFWAIAGKDFLEVCACFLLCGIFLGVMELNMIHKDLEDWEEHE